MSQGMKIQSLDSECGYLDRLDRPLDARQKKVCCRAENTVVAAGAGSGKTQTLATRFAWLVISRNVPASKILTLTFTKKAAGEMYERIYQTLAKIAGHKDTPPAERERAQKALEQFGEAHIQTLDSYCAGIVRQAANRYGIRPDFSTGSADTEREIKNAALPFVMKHRNNPAVRAFADTGRLQDFAETILAGTINKYSSIADEDDFFTRKFEAQKEKVRADFHWFVFGEGMRPAEFEKARNLVDAGHEIEATLDTTTKAGDYVDQCRKIVALINRVLQTEPDSILAEMESLCALANTMPSKGYTKELRSAVKTLKEQTLPYIGALVTYQNQIETMGALFALFDTFNAQIKRAKRMNGRLSFRDIQKMALVILREQDDLREQENNAYEKIMIDEFQDNNGENRDLLFLLCSPPAAGKTPSIEDIAPDKLFFVGDEKQSIYKFRGADVSVFDRLKGDFRRQFGEESFLQMEYNYRSDNELIASFNGLFGGKIGIFDPNLKNEHYEAQYELPTKKYDPKKKEELPQATLNASNLKLHVCILNREQLKENEQRAVEEQQDLLSEKEQLACFIAKKIKSLIETNECRKSDIAILDKSRTDRGILVTWLNRYGIPYSLDQNSNIFASGLVFDIFNFLRLCVYPMDWTARAAFLASPFAGLSENAVETILAETMTQAEKEKSKDEGKDAEETGWTIREGILSADEQRLFEKAGQFFSEMRQQVLSQPLTDTLEYLWSETGYRYETLLSRRAELSSGQYDMLYELARQCDADGKSVAWFVDQLALLREQEKSSFADDADIDMKELTYPIEKEDAVQILTIHKSKGLQYRHVFVYGCIGARMKGEKDKVFFDETYGLSIKPEKGSPNYFVLLQQELAAKKERAEFRRLLYVAITRAEKDAYIVGALSKPQQEDAEKVNLKLMEKQIDAYYPEWSENLSFAEEKTEWNEGAPFDFFQIKPVERSILSELQREKTAGEVRAELIASLKPQYAAATPVVTEHEKPARTTPSALETSGASAGRTDSVGTERSAVAGQTESAVRRRSDPYESVNRIVEKYAPAKRRETEVAENTTAETAAVLQDANFSYADFGTLAHACLEALAHGTKPADFTPQTRLYKNLTESEQSTVLKAARKMAENFTESPLGTALQAARKSGGFVKAEYAFRTMLDIDEVAGKPVVCEADRSAGGSVPATAKKMLVTGAIDLLFEDTENGGQTPAYTIVDYKTDQSICPAMYYAQQKCYRTAAARILGCDESAIRCWLYYLRFGEAVELFVG